MMTAKEANALFHSAMLNRTQTVLDEMRSSFDYLIKESHTDGRDFMICSWNDFRDVFNSETINCYDDYHFYHAAEKLITQLIDLDYCVEFSYDNSHHGEATGIIVAWGDNKEQDIQDLRVSHEY